MLIGKAILNTIVGELFSIESAQSSFAAYPDVPLAVEGERIDLIVGKTIFSRVAGESLAIIDDQSIARRRVGSEPDASLFILNDRRDASARAVLLVCKIFDASAFI